MFTVCPTVHSSSPYIWQKEADHQNRRLSKSYINEEKPRHERLPFHLLGTVHLTHSLPACLRPSHQHHPVITLGKARHTYKSGSRLQVNIGWVTGLFTCRGNDPQRSPPPPPPPPPPGLRWRGRWTQYWRGNRYTTDGGDGYTTGRTWIKAQTKRFTFPIIFKKKTKNKTLLTQILPHYFTFSKNTHPNIPAQKHPL